LKPWNSFARAGSGTGGRRGKRGKKPKKKKRTLLAVCDGFLRGFSKENVMEEKINVVILSSQEPVARGNRERTPKGIVARSVTIC